MTKKEWNDRFWDGDRGGEPENFDGQELLDKIRRSAEQVEVPESLSPENIMNKCRETKQEEPAEKKFRFRNPKLLGVLSAAAVFIICFISLRGTGIVKFAGNRSMSESPAQAMDTGAAESMEEGYAMEAPAESAADFGEETAPLESDAGLAEEAPARKEVGNLYTLAEDYEAVYERLDEIRARNNTESGGAAMAEGGMWIKEPMEDADGAMREESNADFSAGEQIKQELTAEREQYSKTNVQTFGIDESDVVKTDGSYLYLLRGGSVSIVSAGGKMEQVSEIKPEGVDASASVCAMYVDGEKLILMVEEDMAILEDKEAEDGAVYDLLYIDTNRSVSVLTYDINDKKNPVLAGKTTQDGSYVTSRKDGNIVYLFTSKYLLEEYERDPEEVIPSVNERKIAADCIYIGESGERALIVSSLSLYEPDRVRDSVMILDEGSEIYMGEDSLYLYRTDYRRLGETTQIAKFSLTGGFLNGEAAASLRGSVRDTFAIHEKDNKLRVLTSDTSGADWENSLFLLDENLKVTGTLSHLAVGETIYAARYLGDMAYFITYRNMDPLFAVDLSDERNPKLLGELEITGFSEYLHFWGEDKLLGLGFETDPATGEQKGLKLVMFDMSDPTKLAALGTEVLRDTSYSPALYDYKTILVSPEENLIGFVVESYHRGVKRDYELYRWDGERFEKVLSQSLTEDGYDNANYRGFYIGDRFYVAHPEIVRCYDREQYALKQTLKME